MPEAESGYRNPDQAAGPTFADFLILIEQVVKIGMSKAISAYAEWLMEMEIAYERARLCKKVGAQPVAIERKDLEFAVRDLVTQAAQRALPDNNEGLMVVGSHPDCRNASLVRRSKCIAKARGNISDKHWRQYHKSKAIHAIADELYLMVCWCGEPTASQEIAPEQRAVA
jgi:anthranilate/para-aminobenzoate synthase component I